MKRIYILLIIILILFGILWIRINNSNNKPEYSLRDIQKILDKAEDIKNYECELEDGTIYKRKNNKVCIEESTNGTNHIRDYEAKTVITYDEKNKIYMINKLDEELELFANTYAGLSNNSVSRINIASIKEEKYRGNQCLKFEISEKNLVWTYWINVENGFIMKMKYSNGKVHEFNCKLNVVTDEDINPDLTGYKKVEAER